MEEKKEVKKTTTKSKEVKEKQVKPQAKAQTKTQQTKKQSEKLTKKEKTQLCIVLFVIVACIVSIILFVNLKPNTSGETDNPQEENTDETSKVEVNNNKGVTEEKQIDDLKIQNTQVRKENGITYIYADVVNNGKEEQGNFYVYISMKDEKDNEIIGFETMLPLLKPGETTNISVGSTDEFVNAYKCTMTKVEEEEKK